MFKSVTERLSERLHGRLLYKSPIYDMVPRSEHPGYSTEGLSTFTVHNSGPESEDEAWTRVVSVADKGQTSGPCGRSFNDTVVGWTKWVSKPERYDMKGILVCRNDLALNWQVPSFWSSFYKAMEQRSVLTLANRTLHAMMHFSHKAAAVPEGDWDWYAWDKGLLPLGGSSTPAPSLSLLPNPETTQYCDLDQGMLNDAALELQSIDQGGEVDATGWLQMAEGGMLYPLYIGSLASRRLITENSDLKVSSDYAFATLKDANPTLARIGATRILGNFRHMQTPFPPRWSWKADTNEFQYVPHHVRSNAATTFGYDYIVNSKWESTAETFTNGVADGAPYEGVLVMHPDIMHAHPMRPVDQIGNMNWDPVNYLGRWVFRTGLEALDSADCGTNADPFHDYGRHFGQYWTHFEPIIPELGRLIIFKRCQDNWTCNKCS